MMKNLNETTIKVRESSIRPGSGNLAENERLERLEFEEETILLVSSPIALPR